MESKITISTSVQAPLEVVWNAMWDPAHIVHWCFASPDWYCPSAVWDSPKVGGIFTNTYAAKDESISFEITGEYSIVDPWSQVVYIMIENEEQPSDKNRIVVVTFEETSEGVKVTQIFDVEESNSFEQQKEWWGNILENFRIYTESLS